MAFAGGKLILLGEHAVVYGVPAIAAGLTQGASARAVASSSASLDLGELRVQVGDGSELASALEAALSVLNVGPHAIRVELSIPAGAGLGASACIGVAIARAVLEAAGQEDDLGRVLGAAAAWEGVFHGTASGIDAAAAALGGCFVYTRETGAVALPVLRPLSFAVALAGPPQSTREMVESVRRLRERRPEIVTKALDGIHALVKNAELCIRHGDRSGLGKLMDLNQMILSGLFVSTEAIEQACSAARSAGALGAKLTGAGGGGAVIALCEEDPEPILAAFRGLGLTCFASTVLATGEIP